MLPPREIISEMYKSSFVTFIVQVTHSMTLRNRLHLYYIIEIRYYNTKKQTEVCLN
ncbi:protein of unknown function [Streptococcus thermophilus]|uniref:Uncharacterized protein n=1 Tax=Streptococcus thermophilus TaxID=1308 RepID=A0A8D6XR81_STRTR|nr:protein of unknown function [Streptococcus thermophilus]